MSDVSQQETVQYEDPKEKLSRIGENNKKKKKRIKLPRSDKVGYTFDDEDVQISKGKKQQPAKRPNLFKRLSRTSSEDSLTPGNLTNCQAIICSSLISFILCGAGSVLIVTGYLILAIPDIYEVVGPVIIGFGLIILIYSLVLCVRRIRKRLRQVSKEPDESDTDVVASVGYPVHHFDSKITVEEVNSQRRPSVIELYGSVESLRQTNRLQVASRHSNNNDIITVSQSHHFENSSIPPPAIAYPTNPELEGKNIPVYLQQFSTH